MSIHEINTKLIDEISDSFGKEIKSDIHNIMKDCHYNDLAVMVNEPLGENNNEEYKIIKEVWVEQWSIGDSGDSFEGRIYCKIANKLWLMLPYSM